MTPRQFRLWRKKLNLSQTQTAKLLGLNKRMIQYYEKGEREGRSVTIPKYVRLSCYAISDRILDYNGVSPKFMEDRMPGKFVQAGKTEQASSHS